MNLDYDKSFIKMISRFSNNFPCKMAEILVKRVCEYEAEFGDSAYGRNVQRRVSAGKLTQ